MKSKMRPLSTIFLALIASVSLFAICKGQSEILTLDVRIVDREGKPIQDAVVDAWQINEEFFWPSKQVPRKPTKSNSNGVATIRYPKVTYVRESLPVESIKITVYHADFCNAEAVVPVGAVDKNPFEVDLLPGVELTLEAVEENGEPVSKPFAVLTTKMASLTRWNRPTPNQANCRSMKSGNQQIMLVQPSEDGLHRFSDVLSHWFDLNNQPEVKLEGIELQPGIAVRGRLSESVIRPVVNGYVIAIQAPSPAGKTWDEHLPSLVFKSFADIEAEGSFTFASMPHSGSIQLIAVCDGWIGLQEEKSSHIVGETFNVAGEFLEVVLEMSRTFDANIRIIDKNSQPVAGVKVACSPNQLHLKGGVARLGQKFDSISVLLGQIQNDINPAPTIHVPVFEGTTDLDGQLTIRNLPRHSESTFFKVTSDASAKIKVDETLKGVLPRDDQNEVAFDLVLELQPNLGVQLP
jgi:hypothetical protein